MGCGPKWCTGVQCYLTVVGRVFYLDGSWQHGFDVIDSVDVDFAIPDHHDVIVFLHFVEVVEHGTRWVVIEPPVTAEDRVAAFVWGAGVGSEPDAEVECLRVGVVIDGLVEAESRYNQVVFAPVELAEVIL